MLAVHENTFSETADELIEAIDDYLEICAEEGLEPNPTDPDVIREMEAFFKNEHVNGFRTMSDGKLELALAH